MRMRMTTKVLKTLIALVVIAVALLMGNVILTGAEVPAATQSVYSPCCLKVKSCSQQNIVSCCRANKQTEQSPIGCMKECGQEKKKSGTCSKINDPDVCPNKRPKISCPKSKS